MTSPQPPYQGDPNQQQGFAAPQQPQKKKGGCMKWGLIIVGVLVVIAILSSLFGGDSEDADTDAASNNDSSANSQDAAVGGEDAAAEEDATTEFAPGQTYTTSKGLDVTVNSVSTASDALGSSYIAAEVTYLNNGDEQLDFSPTDWSVQTPAGVVSDFSITGMDGQLDSGKLTPGGTITGTVFFEGTDPGEYRIIWEPTFSFSSDSATWIANI